MPDYKQAISKGNSSEASNAKTPLLLQCPNYGAAEWTTVKADRGIQSITIDESAPAHNSVIWWLDTFVWIIYISICRDMYSCVPAYGDTIRILRYSWMLCPDIEPEGSVRKLRSSLSPIDHWNSNFLGTVAAELEEKPKTIETNVSCLRCYLRRCAISMLMRPAKPLPVPSGVLHDDALVDLLRLRFGAYPQRALI